MPDTVEYKETQIDRNNTMLHIVRVGDGKALCEKRLQGHFRLFDIGEYPETKVTYCRTCLATFMAENRKH